MASAEMRERGEVAEFHPDCLVGIILGCRVTPEKIRSVLDLVRQKRYPADVYVCVKDEPSSH